MGTNFEPLNALHFRTEGVYLTKQMVYVRIISVEALKLLARPITEFFSAHLIRNWSIACVSAPFSFVYFSQVYVAIKVA